MVNDTEGPFLIMYPRKILTQLHRVILRMFIAAWITVKYWKYFLFFLFFFRYTYLCTRHKSESHVPTQSSSFLQGVKKVQQWG